MNPGIAPQPSYRGIQYMLISMFGFSLMAVCVKWASESGLPLFEIIAARAFISLVLSYLMVRKKSISIWGHNKLLLACRGIVGAMALICVYYALSVLPLAEAIVFQNTTPILTSILAFFVLKERMHWATIISLVLSAVGVLIIVNPNIFLGISSDANLPVFGVFVALIGACGSAVAYTIVRKLSGSEDPSVIVFYFPMFALPVALVLLGGDFVMPSLTELMMLIAIGLFTQVGQVYLTKAMKEGTAGKTMVYSYLQVVISIIFGVLFFQEIPALTTLFGSVLIISGAVLNLMKSN